jgi:hypothetical protein
VSAFDASLLAYPSNEANVPFRSSSGYEGSTRKTAKAFFDKVVSLILDSFHSGKYQESGDFFSVAVGLTNQNPRQFPAQGRWQSSDDRYQKLR